MIYSCLEEIPYAKERAIIINAGTSMVSTLAIFSALKYIDMPLLVIDCPIVEERKTDFKHFIKLKEDISLDFDLMSLPLQDHGLTLDNIFNTIKGDFVLLIDSDLEILDKKLISFMRKWIQIDGAFGSGFSHGPCPVRANDWINGLEGHYEERMWIPFTFLKVSLVKEAIKAGRSFRGKTFYNVIPKYPRLSKFLFNKFKNTQLLKMFRIFQQDYAGNKPFFSAFDTGADIYQYLKYNKFYFFFGFDANSWIQNEYVCHYSGVTRNLLDPTDHNSTIEEKTIEITIKKRLFELYNYQF